MAITVSGTSITFNDGTVQSTAASSNALYGIGTYIIGRPFNGVYYTVGNTIAGSSLYSMSIALLYLSGSWSPGAFSSSANLTNTGSWRCVSAAWGDGSAEGRPGLWVRYA